MNQPKSSFPPFLWRTLLFVVLLLIGLSVRRQAGHFSKPSAQAGSRDSSNAPADSSGFHRTQTLTKSISTREPTPQEIVSGLVTQAGRSRREIARSMGRRANVLPPPIVEEFFDAIEKGDWNEIEKLWKVLAKKSGQYQDADPDPTINPFWPAIQDAYGIAEQAHMWPPEKLLDYGNAIMKSLRPGMVYVGGTDPGRWIPELLNEGKGEEQHIIVTQNAFADSRYLDYMQEMYKDRMETLTQEDSKRAFDEYVADAQKRLEHDQQFPNEPKQVRPNESIKMVDGKIQVGGQVAVMAINEKLFQALLEKNPDLSFAIEQSHPFKSTYAGATPLGSLMEVRVQNEDHALTPARAADSVDYWRGISEQLFDANGSPLLDEKLRLAYSKLAANQADLLKERNFTTEAEQAFRLAAQISPSSPEAVYGLANVLANQNRLREAIPVIESAVRANPKNEPLQDLLAQAKRSTQR